VSIDIDGRFTENLGQWGPGLRFVAITPFGHVGIGDGCVLYDLHGGTGGAWVVRVTFDGARDVTPRGIGPLPGASNYFAGADQSGWVTGVRSYASVVLEGLWDGVDLVYTIADGSLKYELRLAPRARVPDISMSVEGARVRVDDGELVLETPVGCIRDGDLLVLGEGASRRLPSRFLARGDGFGFAVEGRLPGEALVIDPVVWSTLVGGTGRDRGSDVAVGADGSVYCAGNTFADDFPTTPGAYDTTVGPWTGENIVVFRLDPEGASLEFATYLESRNYDYRAYIYVDDEGFVYVAGQVGGPGFPVTEGAFDTSFNGVCDCFVTKLTPDGSDLVFSTYVGGNEYDRVYDLFVDEEGSCYVGGVTDSTNFPTTTGPYDINFTDHRATVFQVSPDGSELVASRVLGSSGQSMCHGVAVSSMGQVYITGAANGKWPVTEGAFSMENLGSMDMFVTVLSANLSKIRFSTRLGTHNTNDFGMEIVLDQWDFVYVTGTVGGDNFPATEGAYCQESNGGVEGVVFKMDPALSDLLFASYVGGSGADECMDLVLDGNRNLYMVGTTTSTDLPTTVDADQRERDEEDDVFLVKLDPEARELVYGSYYGGNGSDEGWGVALDGRAFVYMTGATESPTFPTTPGAFNRTYNHGEVFVMKVGIGLPSTPLNLTAGEGVTRVYLNWTEPAHPGTSAITNYTVYRGTDEDALDPLVTLGVATSYEDADVVNGQTYHYAVSATNARGEGGRSNLANATPAAPPSRPVALTLEVMVDGAFLEWEPPDDDGGSPVWWYLVYRDDGDDNWTRVERVYWGLNYTNDNMTRWVSHRYCVRAVNRMGPGNESNVVDLALPSPPQDLVVEPGDGFVDLRWEMPLHDHGYQVSHFIVHRWDEVEGDTSYTARYGSLSFTDDYLVNGREYLYRVSAVTLRGAGPPTEYVATTPMGTPGQVENLTAVGGFELVNLSWDPPLDDGGSNITEYRVYRSEPPSTDPTVLASVQRGTSCDVVGLVNGRFYRFSVVAVSDVGTGEPAERSSVPVGPPTTPLDLQATVEKGEVHLGWGPPGSDGGSPVLHYDVYRGTTVDNMVVIQRLENQTYYVDTLVSPGDDLLYAVRAVNSEGASSISDPLPVSLPEKDEGSGGISMWVVAILLVAVGSVVAWFLFMRGRGGQPQSQPEPPPELSRHAHEEPY